MQRVFVPISGGPHSAPLIAISWWRHPVGRRSNRASTSRPLRRRLCMQRWRLDVTSLVSFALVVAASKSLPALASVTFLAAEVAFAAGSFYRYHTHNRHSKSGERGEVHKSGSKDSLPKNGQQFMKKLLDIKEGHLSLLHGGKFLEEWFWGTASQQLGIRNVTDFLAYSIFGQVHPNPAAAAAGGEGEDELLQQATAQFVEALQIPMSNDEHNPSADFITHMKDPLVVSYRPLMFYLLMEAVAMSTDWRLKSRGFKVINCRHSTVYDSGVKAGRRKARSAEDNTPIIFLHGIGAGLAPYTNFVGRLASTGRRVLAVQYKHVSMRLTLDIPSPDEVAEELAAFLEKQGITKATVVGHSYGTLVAASLIKHHPDMVQGLTLIDPVCFALFLPHLLKNALYFQRAEAARALLLGKKERWTPKRLLRGLIIRDFHCAVAMCRRLDWRTVNLWPSELPRDTTIVLSGKDNLVPVEPIQSMLANRLTLAPGAPVPTVLYNADHGHGGFLLDGQAQTALLAAIFKGQENVKLTEQDLPARVNMPKPLPAPFSPLARLRRTGAVIRPVATARQMIQMLQPVGMMPALAASAAPLARLRVSAGSIRPVAAARSVIDMIHPMAMRSASPACPRPGRPGAFCRVQVGQLSSTVAVARPVRRSLWPAGNGACRPSQTVSGASHRIRSPWFTGFSGVKVS